MLYVIAGTIIVILICAFAYMHYFAKRTPSIIGNEYDKELQTKIKEIESKKQ